MTTTPERIALVTGANRGIGLAVVQGLAQRGYTTILGARDLEKGRAAAEGLVTDGLTVLPRQLDVTDEASIATLAREVEASFGHLDVLVNNAAILYDTWQTPLKADFEVVQQAMDTNVYGAWRMAQAFGGLLRASRSGRLVNVSSQLGALNTMGAGSPAYSVSKAALNALTRVLAAELRPAGVLVNSVCPGWVATDMGGSGGRPIEAGAASVLWAVDLPDDGPTGGFFRDGKPLAW